MVEVAGDVLWVRGVSCDICPAEEGGSTLEQVCAMALTSLLRPGLHHDFLAFLEIRCAA